jgi:hypothetical protein
MLGVNLGNLLENPATNMAATGTWAIAIHECRGSVAKICSGIKKRYPNNNDGGVLRILLWQYLFSGLSGLSQ